ncbi:MAG: hypothetical protein O3A46_15875 [Candidatus Poribacteria bacterium]|nr:hypothetical protein [Candidatus Poribacteria bacterium]
MRILMINHEFPPVGGGGGLVTAFLAREYVRAGHDVLVLTSAYRDLPRFETRDGYQIERVPALRINPNVAEIHEMGSWRARRGWGCGGRGHSNRMSRMCSSGYRRDRLRGC